MIVYANTYEEALEEINRDDLIEEAIKNESPIIELVVIKKVKYHEKIDEWEEEEIYSNEVDIREFDIDMQDVLEHCNQKCKGE